MINYSSFVMFANKINCQTSVTLECVEQQKINTFTVYASYTCARHTTSIIDYISLCKNVNNINFIICIAGVFKLWYTEGC